ncbi:phosphotransferase [Xylanimonas ulmi]|uniref:Aminoglycoside phosphotransferase (APT) family kinase protein n=1 Tax=Xylanimonas ulmi TaxID=228973 RepID=A0A4V2EXY2_9MICO|nr:phosphotransferase [Xylanibacterium ulmi]RZS61080.1 aminoglycoside phosphotransferase (APT) family kinase protein [Xylanibacterium ulmi]
MRAELDVTVALARALLREQHPDLAALPLRVAANGWDNVMVRAGERLVLRLPRRAAAAPLVEHERAALPLLAPTLRRAVPDVVVPVPLRAGAPSAALGYPWPWSVAPWADGVAAAATPVPARRAWAPTLGRLLAALHRPPGGGVLAPHNPFRGVPLRQRARPALAETEPGARLWDAALAAAPYDGPPVWLHGDPHPANLVVAPASHHGARDRLAAVVDFGDVTAGDPASDLGSLWLTFDAAGRAACRDALTTAGAGPGGAGWDEATWTRARGWALVYASAMLAHPDLHPGLAPIGEHAIGELFAGR